MEWSPVQHKSPWTSLPCLAVLIVKRNTSITMNQRSRASSPSMRNPASKEMISDSVELWDTDVCFLHIQLTGTKCSTSKNTQDTSRGWFWVLKVISTILQQIRVLPFWIDHHPSKDLKHCTAALYFCLPIRSISKHIFGHVLPCRRTRPPCLGEFFPPWKFFSCSSRNTWFEYPLRSRWVHPRCSWSRNDVGSSRSIFHQFLPHGSHILLLSSHVDVIHVYWQT